MNDNFNEDTPLPNTTAVTAYAEKQQSPPISQQQAASYNADGYQKSRRVGTFTMGLALIVTGIAALISLIMPNNFDFLWFARLSPLILVFLGVEILLSNFLGHGIKLKYDFLSGFVCFILITSSICVMSVPPLLKQYGFREYDNKRLSKELSDIFYSKLEGTPVASLDATVYINGLIDNSSDITVHTLRPQDYANVKIDLLGNFTDKASFAKECKTILDKLVSENTPNTNIDFFNLYDDTNAKHIYDLSINDKHQYSLTTEQLTQMITDRGTELVNFEIQNQKELENLYISLEDTQE
ncbi:MAG: hypothetical protein RR251_02665 [Hydrogenoanaerobacterium sp.]